jgi:hypothetical protein
VLRALAMGLWSLWSGFESLLGNHADSETPKSHQRKLSPPTIGLERPCPASEGEPVFGVVARLGLLTMDSQAYVAPSSGLKACDTSSAAANVGRLTVAALQAVVEPTKPAGVPAHTTAPSVEAEVRANAFVEALLDCDPSYDEASGPCVAG